MGRTSLETYPETKYEGFKKKICISYFPSNDLFYYTSQALPKDQLNEFSYKICYLRATVDTFVPSLH